MDVVDGSIVVDWVDRESGVCAAAVDLLEGLWGCEGDEVRG